MKTFEINGKVYHAKPIDFNAICDLEDLGLDVSDIFNKQMKGARAYLAFCGGMDVESAGLEIQAHVISKKNINDIIEAMQNAVIESDFFRPFTQGAEEETQEDQAEAAEEVEVTEIPEKKAPAKK